MIYTHKALVISGRVISPVMFNVCAKVLDNCTFWVSIVGFFLGGVVVVVVSVEKNRRARKEEEEEEKEGRKVAVEVGSSASSPGVPPTVDNAR